MTSIDETKQYYEGAFLGFGYTTETNMRNIILNDSINRAKEDPYNESKYHKEDFRKAAILNNASNYLGYIPVIGLITGCIKFAKASCLKSIENDIDALKNRTLRVRGIVEVFGAGILCLPFDIYG